MTICVKDLSGSGNLHDPLNVSYIVTGGECVSFLPKKAMVNIKGFPSLLLYANYGKLKLLQDR